MLDNSFLTYSRQQASHELATASSHLSFDERICLLLRSGSQSKAESELLSSFGHPSFHSLLLLLRIYQGRNVVLESLLESSDVSAHDISVTWFAKQTNLMWRAAYQDIVDFGLPLQPESLCSPWHRLILLNALLWLGKNNDFDYHHRLLDSTFVPSERLELEARLAVVRDQPKVALDILSPLLESGDASPLGWEMAFHSLSAIGELASAQTMIQRARTLFPVNSRLISRSVVLAVTQRQPVNGRRLSLLERLFDLENTFSLPERRRSHQNLAYAYENGGRADLLSRLHSSVRADSSTWEVLGNHALQMASLVCPTTPQAFKSAQALLPRDIYSYDDILTSRESIPGAKLRVGYITPDVHYHPVCRFLLMQLNNNKQFDYSFYVIRTGGPSDWVTDLTKTIAQQHGEWLDISHRTFSQQLDDIRSLNLDIAVDLSGWTAHATPGLFASKVAPIQVNYLGFFASTGLPEMDYWLGDSALFPQNTNEWSTESIWRLPRCLAWQPLINFLRKSIVPAGPANLDFVLGSFNHVRKLVMRLFVFGDVSFKLCLQPLGAQSLYL